MDKIPEELSNQHEERKKDSEDTSTDAGAETDHSIVQQKMCTENVCDTFNENPEDSSAIINQSASERNNIEKERMDCENAAVSTPPSTTNRSRNNSETNATEVDNNQNKNSGEGTKEGTENKWELAQDQIDAADITVTDEKNASEALGKSNEGEICTQENIADDKPPSGKLTDIFVGRDEENDSQESTGLVIDEKMNAQEDDYSENKDVALKKDVETEHEERMSKDDEQNSMEDRSELSVATQINTNEVDNKTEHIDGEKGLENETKIENTHLNSTAKVIEIDDDVDEGAAQNAANDSKEVVVIEVGNEIPIIEIDDDEEDIKEKPIDTQHEKQRTLDDSVEKLSKADEMDITTMETTKSELTIAGQDAEMRDVATDVNASIVDAKTGDVPFQTDADSLLKEDAHSRQPSPTPVEDDSNPDDTRDEVFYNKECINYECPKTHKQYFRIPQFALSYFKVAKKRCKVQYICADCYDKALDIYEEFCGLLTAKQPLLLRDIASGRQEFVEIIDSSDEDDGDATIEKEKECASFSKRDLNLIENELENSIKKVLTNVEIQNQLTWSKKLLITRARRLEEESNYIDVELRSLQKKADNMHVSLYQCPKIKIRQLQPLDLNSGRSYLPLDSETSQLPSIGEIHRPPVQINEMYYAVKNKAIASWVPCKVIEQVEGTMGTQKNLKHYKVKFLKSQYQMLKTVSVKHLAYYDPPPVRLPIGSRVIAYFDATSLSRGKEKMLIQSAFYPGIIAEPLKPNNKYRYLIFYDDGYTQYVSHKDVRLVCSVAENVWEDVHPNSRDFIQKYLTQYSINRPMVQTQKGQSMTTESNGKWIYARVVDIDCSLIQMQFEGPKCHNEWIYRGSLRLGPVFKEYQKSLQKDNLPISRLPRRTEPFIRYTADEEATATAQHPERSSSTESRAVAKKSVSRQESCSNNTIQSQVPTVRHLNNSTIYLEDENKPKGKVVYYTAKRNLPPLAYKPHKCTPNCLFKITHNLNAYSPLSKPLLSGWERLIMRQKIKKVVAYRAPCGKIMRNMKELHHYLRVTENVLNVDNFDFNHETSCLAEYVIESAIVQKRDISGGQEKMTIPLVNYYDNTMPPECKYAAQRIPTEGVNLNLDEEFLVGCDCKDDCSNKEKCSCWQLTYAGAKYGNPNTPMEEIGYQYKRLYEHVPTGIYECNSRCKCKSNCLNRVVQHSLQMKLQVFKTSNRGWGLRCINDVPKGSFICIYAGHLLTEAKANEGGLDAGDEYFAELDYIEVAEQIKEGYESDVELPEPEEDEDIYAPEHDDDDEFTPSKSFLTRARNKAQKSTRTSTGQNVDEDSQERQVINFNPNADMNENSVRESSIRKLFGKDEACYVMDAKTIGNLGRYFNHSCSPNLFVQNVFVDTHDLRFPWVAFFALSHIRAGTELTWNYNYEVGVVPGKVLYCQCGAPNCRLRLL